MFILYREFISIASTGETSVSGVGTVGISSDAKITLSYSNDTPKNIFYTFEVFKYLCRWD